MIINRGIYIYIYIWKKNTHKIVSLYMISVVCKHSYLFCVLITGLLTRFGCGATTYVVCLGQEYSDRAHSSTGLQLV